MCGKNVHASRWNLPRECTAFHCFLFFYFISVNISGVALARAVFAKTTLTAAAAAAAPSLISPELCTNCAIAS